ncbi:MAG: lysophospholipid acyltransferase family protein [Rickettsiaceae bacterium]|nr:lysophospholipid acyltransferase family protein [Rickettsiaceae bacterium]
MIKRIGKYLFKNNVLLHKLVTNIVFVYLKLVYATNKWTFLWPEQLSEEKINSKDGVLFAVWHNRLAFSIYMCRNYDGMYGLASPHRDGKIIIDIVKKMGYKIIEGSTNRKPVEALRSIIKQLKDGNKVLITPDGPRGPVYKVNSSMVRIGKKYNKDIIPISCAATKYFQLKTWDNMIIPKMFGRITVTIGAPLELSGNEVEDNKFLEKTLMELSAKAESITQVDN